MEREIIERPIELEDFKSEIGEWILSEMEKKKEWQERGEEGEAYDPHADFIRPELLNDTDLAIWNKIKNETVTNEDMVEYNRKFDQEIASEAPDVIQAREEFKAMITNKSIPILIKGSKM